MKIRYYIFFALISNTLILYFSQNTTYFIITASISAVLIFIKWLKALLTKIFDQKIIAYVGPTGAGKTGCAVGHAIKYDKQMDKPIRKDLTPLYEDLKNNGYPHININELDTFIYSDTPIRLNKGKISYDFDFNSLGIPTRQHPHVKNYPFGAYFIADEMNTKADNRKWQSFSDNLRYYIKLHRKAYQNLSVIAQNLDSVDKSVRDEVHSIRFMLQMDLFKVPFLNIWKTTWTFIEYTGPGAFQNYEKRATPNILNWPYVRHRKFSIWCNIFERYDSRMELCYFLERLERFETKKSVFFNYSRKAVKEYIKNHPLFKDDPKKEEKEKQTKKGEEEKNVKNEKLNEKRRTIHKNNINSNQFKSKFIRDDSSN